MHSLIRKTYYESLFDISVLEENIHMIAYSLLAFFIPFLLGHPQIVVGVIVNASLILGATYLKGHKLLPVIMLPSLGVLSRGVIFGPFTIYLVYMIPFIWLGNAIFAYGFKYLLKRKLEQKHKVVTILLPVMPGALKTAFLFTAAIILVKLSVIPTIFLTTMGPLQLLTAFLGGSIGVALISLRSWLGKKIS